MTKDEFEAELKAMAMSGKEMYESLRSMPIIPASFEVVKKKYPDNDEIK